MDENLNVMNTAGASGAPEAAGKPAAVIDVMTAPPIGKEQVRQAAETLRRYRAGKTMLEHRIIENEQFWKLRHWAEMKGQDANPNDPRPASAWLVNVILNRHADAIDNYPEPNCLPRAADDVEEARKLSKILPVILRQNGFAQVYSDVWWYKLKAGTGCYGVFWDSSKLGGLGDVSIRKVDLLNLFWEPGVDNIQASRNLFSVKMEDNETLEEQFPQLRGKLKDGAAETVSQFRSEENRAEDTDKSLVVDWYYRRRGILHFCKFCGEEVLYSSENVDPHKPWYDHNKYPFVLDVLFPEEGMPCGFGFIDIAKDPQKQIDLLNQAMLKNALAGSTPRYFIRNDGAVNEEEFGDWTRPLVHVDGQLGQDSIMLIQTKPLDGNHLNFLRGKEQELRETSGNTEANTGSVPSSVTAASAIAALQEASGKLSRDMINSTYRAFEEICLLVIDLIRQFYDLPRQFRITGEMDRDEFTSYDNSGLRPRKQMDAFGVELGYRSPVLDIEVTPQKESRYTKAEYNELAMNLYGAGFFSPQRVDEAQAALKMMDFKGRGEVMENIRKNASLQQRLEEFQRIALKLAQIADSHEDTNWAEQVAARIVPGAAPVQAAAPVPAAKTENGGESHVTARAREQTRAAAEAR